MIAPPQGRRCTVSASGALGVGLGPPCPCVPGSRSWSCPTRDTWLVTCSAQPGVSVTCSPAPCCHEALLAWSWGHLESPCSPWTPWKPEGPFFILRSIRGRGPPERGGLEAESPQCLPPGPSGPWAQKMSVSVSGTSGPLLLQGVTKAGGWGPAGRVRASPQALALAAGVASV